MIIGPAALATSAWSGRARSPMLPEMDGPSRRATACGLAALFVASTAGCGPDIQAYTYDGVRPWQTFEWHDGRRHGQFREYWENGTPRQEGRFRRGRLDGDWRLTYASGAVMAELHYERGLRQGTWTEWYENGARKSEVLWRDGDRDGTATHWREDGAVEEIQRWVEGSRVEVRRP